MLEEITLQGPIDAIQFRAQKEQYLTELDDLEESPFIERRDEIYRVRLLGLVELKDEIDYAANILNLCEAIFDILRVFYKSTPKKSIALIQLSRSVKEEEHLVRIALTYLKDAPIFGGYTTDLLNAEDVHIKPSERILRYQNFQEVIEQLIDWAQRPLFSNNLRYIDDSICSEFKNEQSIDSNVLTEKLPDWYKKLPPPIFSLLQEIQYAKSKDIRALPSMGLRAVIDSVCNDLMGDDIGTFEKKLIRLEEERHITPKQRQILLYCIEVGHASVHRGHFPMIKHLDAVLEAVEHLLREVYVLGTDAEDAYKATPKRNYKK